MQVRLSCKRTILSLALMCWVSAATAQSNVTGSIYGQAPAGADVSVVIRNLDTGQSRTVAVDAAGRYRAAALPDGRYRVSVARAGVEIAAREEVQVLIASGAEVSFAEDAVQELAGVEVRGSAGPRIDVSQVDARSVFTAEELQKLAIPRGIAEVAMLAPGVVRNDSYGVPSFGGSASSENAYFINGYPVTNPLSSIGFTTLPFEAISQQQVLVGGYGAEFGRSTGGVINIVTKRGGNEWRGGGYTIWAPEGLRASVRNSYYPNTGFYGPDHPDPSRRTDGTLRVHRGFNNSWNETTGLWAGGPLLKDRLFVHADAELTRQEGTTVGVSTAAPANTANGWREYAYRLPRWAAKLDWWISDDHVLEYTGVSDVSEFESRGYAFNYADLSHGDTQNAGSFERSDSKLHIGKYTGYLGENLVVSALYGRHKTSFASDPWGYDPACPYVAAGAVARHPSIPSANYRGCWTADRVQVDGRYNETRGGRLDVNYRLGDHDLRVGYDRLDAESFTGSEYGGGFVWVYSRTNAPNAAIDASHGVSSPASAGGLGTQGYYVRRQYYTQTAKVRTEQQAQYIEDRWQVDDRWLLSLGLRNEQFSNFTGSGERYVSQRNQWAPRLGAVWDARGDSSLKLFANAGRYHLALPNNVAVRAASGSLYTMEYFTYTGVDPKTGAPTGLVNVPVDTSLGYACAGNPNAISANLECGDAPDPRTVAAVDIKSHYQDEYIVGLEQQLGPQLRWGARLIYRDLRSAIDDTCTPVLGGRCFLFNPGVGNTFWQERDDGSFEQVHYSAEQLALPKLKRRYYALDLFAEGRIGEKFAGRAEYLFSRNYGNTEGQLASDLDTGGGGQADVSVTQDWDLPQLMDGASGLLPNHRSHQFKAFGSYQWSPQWRSGFTVILASGRPRNCTSFYPTADPGLYAGAYYYYCGLAGSGTAPGSRGYTPPSEDYRPSPRGSQGTTPWSMQLNFNTAYTPAWADGKLSLQADVINLLNRQVAGSYNSQYASDRNTPSESYGQELNVSAPRYVRLMARYSF